MRTARPDTAVRAQLAERALARDIALRSQLAPRRETPRPSYSDIYRAAAFGDREAIGRVEQAATEDAAIARAYSEALGRECLAAFGELRAADTGEAAPRRAGAYTVEIRHSRNRTDRSFLIVTCDAGAPAPAWLRILPEPGKPPVAAMELPAPVDGAIQVILPRDHPAIAAVLDPERHFHLG